MNDDAKKPVVNYTFSITPTQPAGFLYVTMKIDNSAIIEDKLSKMQHFKEASEVLSKFTSKK